MIHGPRPRFTAVGAPRPGPGSGSASLASSTFLAPMLARLFPVLLAVVLFTGCTWEGRPDGASAVHTASDGYFDGQEDPVDTPLGGRMDIVDPVDGEIVEPLGDVASPAAPPVPTAQPAPTTGTDDNTSEVEEALTPGSEQ